MIFPGIFILNFASFALVSSISQFCPQSARITSGILGLYLFDDGNFLPFANYVANAAPNADILGNLTIQRSSVSWAPNSVGLDFQSAAALSGARVVVSQ